MTQELQELFYRLKNQLSSAETDGRRASRDEMFGIHGMPGMNLNHSSMSSAGYSIKIAQQHWTQICDLLSEIRKTDGEIQRVCNEITHELQTAYSHTCGNNYPNSVATAVSQVENHIGHLKRMLIKHKITLR